jgi:hypothetical protein
MSIMRMPYREQAALTKRVTTLGATEEIFAIGSTSPSAMLYDALDHFEV